LDYFILLYQSERDPNYGHWTCVINHQDCVEFFDSLGGAPDRSLREMRSTQYAKLSEMLLKNKKPVVYNDHVLQGNDSSVCGRWVIARCMMRDTPLSDFQKIFEGNQYFTPDECVTRMIRVQPDLQR